MSSHSLVVFEGQSQQKDPVEMRAEVYSVGPDIAGASSCCIGGAGAATGLGEDSAVSVLGR